MKRVFNMGIGYCFIVEEDIVDELRDFTESEHSIKSWIIGDIVNG